MNNVEIICKKAKDNCIYLQGLSSAQKNAMLQIIADSLVEKSQIIIDANKQDMENNAHKPSHILDRLMLNEDRIKGIAQGLESLILLDDPIGETIEATKAKKGFNIKKIRVPLGVIGIIYEARPNVTIDAIGLCLKTSNAIVLRGSKDAICSNKALVGVVKASLEQNGYNNAEFIQLLEDTTRESAEMLMCARGFVDVLLPRGTAELINTVVEKSTVPVIETGAGNCHAYVHSKADFEMAKSIILNGKLSRPSVCNALESIVVDRQIASEFIPFIATALINSGVEVVGCDESVKIFDKIKMAEDMDFYKEFLSLKISVKVVNDLDDAIRHINEHSTKHSEVIITSDESAANRFCMMVDSAAVYHNVSTRFTDGFEFGFGAEIGISTQKIHARGPLGLKQLTSEKYIVFGDGQVRV